MFSWCEWGIRNGRFVLIINTTCNLRNFIPVSKYDLNLTFKAALIGGQGIFHLRFQITQIPHSIKNKESNYFSHDSLVNGLRTQTYFRLLPLSTENNIRDPEPGNYFCDLMTFISLWPIRFFDRMKIEHSVYMYLAR